jgi:general secretion pathway protein I
MERSGFTLMETLVALSILGIALAVILELFSGGLRSARLSDDYTRAAMYGKQKMEEILSSGLLEEGTREGDLGDTFTWKTSIFRLEPPEEEAGKTPFSIYRVEVRILWGADGGKKSFDLSTMKITEKPEKG